MSERMLEISPGRYKPVSLCTPRDARAATKVQHQRQVTIARCQRLLLELGDDYADRLPPLLAGTFEGREIPEDTSLPDLRECWRTLARLRSAG